MTVPPLQGRPERLWVLDYGLFEVHGPPPRRIGLMGALIRTDAGEHVLVDTGLPAKYAADPEGAAAEDGLDGFGRVLACGPAQRPEAQAALCGVQAGAIDRLVITHSHIDHIGGLHAFAQAPLVIAAAERALPRPLYWSGAQPLCWPERETQRIAADTALGPGLEALLAPGHTVGQLALWIALPEGPVLWCSDAISRPSEIEEGFAGAADPAAARGSARRLLARAVREGARVIYGHCPVQWPGLPKAPAPFARTT